jgi:hypothetical protein
MMQLGCRLLLRFFADFGFFADQLPERWPFRIKVVLTRNPHLAELESVSAFAVAHSLKHPVIDLGLEFFRVSAECIQLFLVENSVLPEFNKIVSGEVERPIELGQTVVDVEFIRAGKIRASHLAPPSAIWLGRVRWSHTGASALNL